jgi:hypothetical protein
LKSIAFCGTRTIARSLPLNCSISIKFQSISNKTSLSREIANIFRLIYIQSRQMPIHGWRKWGILKDCSILAHQLSSISSKKIGSVTSISNKKILNDGSVKWEILRLLLLTLPITLVIYAISAYRTLA